MIKPTYKAIVAISENNVIGNNGDIPWHLPEDFKWFKQATMGGILIMGRKTYDSIGKPLPGRETIVVSRTETSIAGVRCISNLVELNNIDTTKTIWVVGGSEIYKQLLPQCSDLYVSRIHQVVEGDTFFPCFNAQFTLSSSSLYTDDFTVEHWKNFAAQ